MISGLAQSLHLRKSMAGLAQQQLEGKNSLSKKNYKHFADSSPSSISPLITLKLYIFSLGWI